MLATPTFPALFLHPLYLCHDLLLHIFLQRFCTFNKVARARLSELDAINHSTLRQDYSWELHAYCEAACHQNKSSNTAGK